MKNQKEIETLVKQVDEIRGDASLSRSTQESKISEIDTMLETLRNPPRDPKHIEVEGIVKQIDNLRDDTRMDSGKKCLKIKALEEQINKLGRPDPKGKMYYDAGISK